MLLILLSNQLPLTFPLLNCLIFSFYLTVEELAAKKRRMMQIAPLDYREATLVLNSVKFRAFPVNDKSDFGQFRTDPAYAYFDHTHYISVLEPIHQDQPLLFLQPWGFGKSLM